MHCKKLTSHRIRTCDLSRCSDGSMWLPFWYPLTLSQIVRLTLKYEILWLRNNITVTSQKTKCCFYCYNFTCIISFLISRGTFAFKNKAAKYRHVVSFPLATAMWRSLKYLFLMNFWFASLTSFALLSCLFGINANSTGRTRKTIHCILSKDSLHKAKSRSKTNCALGLKFSAKENYGFFSNV